MNIFIHLSPEEINALVKEYIKDIFDREAISISYDILPSTAQENACLKKVIIEC